MKTTRSGSTLVKAGVWLAALVPVLAGAQESPWPMFRHDLKHSGRTSFTGPPAPTVAWTFRATDGIVSSPTIAADGTIYVGAGWYWNGTTDHHVYALNPDGTLKWSYEGADGFFSSPVLGPDNTIYLSCLDGSLYAIHDQGTSGQRRWKTDLETSYALSSPAIGADGTVYVGSTSFGLYAVRPQDGSIKWNWYANWCIISSPAIGADGIIYVGSKDHHLYAFTETLQAPAWAFATGTFFDGHLVDSSPAIGADGTLYVGSDPYGAAGQQPVVAPTNFWAVNPDGTLKWSFDTGDGVESSPALGADGTIYFGSYDHYLYALMDTGSAGVLKWRFQTNGPIDGSPTVDGDGVIYFGSRDATLYALYPDGTVKWTFQGFADGGFEGSPTIDDKGYLYIGSFDHNLYVLGTGGPDVGVEAVEVPARVVARGTYTPVGVVRNYRAAEQQVSVTCVIRADGEDVYKDTVVVTAAGGSSSQVTFVPWTVGDASDVHYTLTVTTMLVGDENPDNDELCAETVSISPYPLGDLNCDGAVNFDDIGPFVLALSDPPEYAAAYPHCDALNADCNGDGQLSFDDINPFVALLGGI